MSATKRLPRQSVVLGIVFFMLAILGTSASQAVSKKLGLMGYSVMFIVLVRYVGQFKVALLMLLRKQANWAARLTAPRKRSLKKYSMRVGRKVPVAFMRAHKAMHRKMLVSLRKAPKTWFLRRALATKAPVMQLRRALVAIFCTIAIFAKAQYLDIGVGNAVSLALSPLFLLLYAPFFEKSKVTGWTILAVIIGLCGVWVMAPGGISLDMLKALGLSVQANGLGALNQAGNQVAVIFLLGMFWSVCGSGSDALNNHQNRAAGKLGDSKLTSVFYQAAFGAPVLVLLFIAGVITIGNHAHHDLLKEVGLFVALIALGLVPQTLLLMAGERTEVSRLAPYRSIQVFFGCGFDLLIGALITQEKKTAMAIMVLAMLVGMVPELKKLLKGFFAGLRPQR